MEPSRPEWVVPCRGVANRGPKLTVSLAQGHGRIPTPPRPGGPRLLEALGHGPTRGRVPCRLVRRRCRSRDPCRPAAAAMNDPLIVVRLLPGRCGESQRVAHLVPLPAQASDMPDVLHAYCGWEIVRGEYELLPG